MPWDLTSSAHDVIEAVTLHQLGRPILQTHHSLKGPAMMLNPKTRKNLTLTVALLALAGILGGTLVSMI